MATLVPKVRTTATPAAIYSALAAAWQSVFGTTPSRSSLLVLLAQSSFETGAWASCWNWNLGNIKHSASDGQDYLMLTCTEVDTNGVTTSSPCYFRAYATATAGAADLIKLLHTTHYAGAWNAVLAGDPHAFVQQLKTAGYFTGAETTYETAVAALYAKYNASVTTGAPLPAPIPASPSFALLALGVLALGGIAYAAVYMPVPAIFRRPVTRRRARARQYA
jgi:hypothetical protein